MRPSVFLLSLSLISSASAEDWSRFRGAGGQGIATSTLPENLSVEKNLKWSTELPGAGSSSPIIVGKRAFVTCYDGVSGREAKRLLVCLDAETGKIAWTRSIDAPTREDAYSGFLREHGYASGSPVSDGEMVYAFFGKAGVAAFTMEGEPVWQKTVGQMSGNRRWGSAASPVIAGDVLIVNASEEARAIFGLDKKTGEQLWKAASPALELCYATPALITAEDGATLAVIPMPREVWALDVKTGDARWVCGTETGGNVSPSAVISDDMIYTFGGYPAQQTNAIKRGGTGDVTETHRVWQNRDSSYVPTPVYFENHLYWVSDKAQAFVVNATTGETVHRERLRGIRSGGRPVYASPIKVGSLIYAVTRRSGIYIFKAEPEMPQVAKIEPLDESDFNATPAVVNNRMYLRSDEKLYCFE